MIDKSYSKLYFKDKFSFKNCTLLLMNTLNYLKLLREVWYSFNTENYSLDIYHRFRRIQIKYNMKYNPKDMAETYAFHNLFKSYAM